MNIENRIKRLESVVRDEKISWKTYSGEAISCFPEELFSLEANGTLKSKVLDADLSTFSGEGSLPSFVRAFWMSQPDQEMEKGLQVAKMLAELGIPFHWEKGEYERR